MTGRPVNEITNGYREELLARRFDMRRGSDAFGQYGWGVGERQRRRCTMCLGVGQGIAVILERV
jgi:hypothetical protein